MAENIGDTTGPEEMIFSSKKALESLGVDKEKIKFELFTAPVKKAEEVIAETLNEDFDGNSKVTVICDDEEVEFDLNKDGDSILDAAMDQDLDVPFSCKGAVCCTCKAKVTKGKVIMDANYALSDQEVEDGYILSCQAHPAWIFTTKNLIEDYYYLCYSLLQNHFEFLILFFHGSQTKRRVTSMVNLYIFEYLF